MTKLLSILIPVYNNWKLTGKCIASILNSSLDKNTYEIVVINNASTDFTSKLLETISETTPLKVITHKENLGFVKGYNSVWPSIETPLCLLLSNDVTLENDCISKMISAAESDPKIGIVGAVQYFPNGQREPPLRWFHREGPELGKPFKTEPDSGLTIVENNSVGFACALIKKEVWQKIGYLDELFQPCMFEQEDYCLRAKEAGYKIVLSTEAHFVHLVAATTCFNHDYFQELIKINWEKFKTKWGEKLRKGEI